MRHPRVGFGKSWISPVAPRFTRLEARGEVIRVESKNEVGTGLLASSNLAMKF